MLFNKGIILDKNLLLEKLKEENSRLDDLKIPSKEAYQTELNELLSYLPPYEQVKDYVLRMLPGQKV